MAFVYVLKISHLSVGENLCFPETKRLESLPSILVSTGNYLWYANEHVVFSYKILFHNLAAFRIVFEIRNGTLELITRNNINS